MELENIIEELEKWHRIRSRINYNKEQNKKLVMDTLPRAIEQLKNYRDLLITTTCNHDETYHKYGSKCSKCGQSHA